MDAREHFNIVDKAITPSYKAFEESTYRNTKGFVNYSTLKHIKKSPELFLYNYLNPPEQTDAMRLGTAIHLALLEPDEFRARFVRMPKFGNQNSHANKAAKLNWEASLRSDAVPVTEDQQDMIIKLSERIKNHRSVLNLVKNGHKEICGFFTDPTTMINCKFKSDLISHINGDTYYLDFKTISNLDDWFIKKQVKQLEYLLQLGFTAVGIKEIEGRYPKECGWVFMSTKAPFEIKALFADPATMEYSIALYNRLMLKLLDCVKSNKFPSYQENGEFTYFGLNDWELKDELDTTIEGETDE